MNEQETIQVECVPPACQLQMFWWQPLGVSASRVGGEYVLGEVGIL